ncbi:hypothetical protein EYF80_059512 [Liparis tanakae]|uniref:Uncharacterized protein n=1 Tax=Liparis tanakae TaxID=230148 RepID=A0A4Z2EPK1_9TELE|nr:hypothetical protein EYF80_059512 [Liparis tanakae]
MPWPRCRSHSESHTGDTVEALTWSWLVSTGPVPCGTGSFSSAPCASFRAEEAQGAAPLLQPPLGLDEGPRTGLGVLRPDYTLGSEMFPHPGWQA